MLFCTTSNRLHVFTRFVLISGILLLFTSVIPDIACAQKVDPELKPYEPVGGEVAGSLKGVGSDTMNNLMALWTEGFKKFYPSVREGIEGKGSSSAPPALMEGTSTFGPMSRPWKPSEIDAFKDHFGYPPTVIPSAIDMLAVYVHKDNPIKGLSLQQVDAIFSKNRNGQNFLKSNLKIFDKKIEDNQDRWFISAKHDGYQKKYAKKYCASPRVSRIALG